MIAPGIVAVVMAVVYVRAVGRARTAELEAILADREYVNRRLFEAAQ